MLARLLIGFLAVIVPSTVLLGGVTFHSLTSLDRVNRDLVQIMHSRAAVADLRPTLTQVGAPLGAYMLGGDVRNRARFEELISAAEDKLQSCALAPCHVSIRTPENMAQALRPVIERVKGEGRLIFEEGPRSGEAHAEAVRQSVAGMRSAIEPMLSAVREREEELERAAGAVRRRAWFLTVPLMVGIALVGCAAAIFIARRISRPLSDLVSGTRRVMAGDWAYQASVAAPGEIGELASSFNTMVHEIRQQREQLEEQNRTLEARARRRTAELRQKEQALLQSEKLASLGLLAAGVAHELNNPLTSIVMNTNLLSEAVGEGSPLYKELKKIDADAGRCRRIIEDLRAFARLRQVEKAPGEVEAVVDQALSLVAHELSRRQVHVQRDLAPDLPKVAWDPGRMVQVLSNLLVNKSELEQVAHGRFVIGQSLTMQRLFDNARTVACTDSSVLITGRSGTGKEVLARFIHASSVRQNRPFVTVNCAAIPANLLESELFGHSRGAFTGAVSSRRGSFELAHGGTLFLDEIGEMPLDMQVKILRALEERQIKRVGWEEAIKVDIRIITATNKELEQETRAGRFREDLYWRLNVVQFVVPPLCERPDDVIPLARHFLSTYAREQKKPVRDFSPEALETFTHYDWPGNVRELRNAVERAVIFADPGKPIRLSHLPPHLRNGRGPPPLGRLRPRGGRHAAPITQFSVFGR